MAMYKKEVGGGMVGINSSLSMVYRESTAKTFIEDAIYLYKQAVTAKEELEGKRFSRLAIMVIPFYLDSISNYLFDIFINKKLDDVDKSKLPIPIRRFRAVYNKCLNKKLKEEDINGIRDIFTIRNKITAHPAGRSSLTITENVRKRNDIIINYLKYKDLPQIYSYFYPEHMHLIFTEVYDFLTNYITSIKHKLTDEQYKYIWPKDLEDWKSTQAK